MGLEVKILKMFNDGTSDPCFGFADASYKKSTAAGDFGVGEDNHSWGANGDSTCITHKKQKKHWGLKWNEGDKIGIFLDIDTKTISYGLNGNFAVLQGTAFKDFEYDKYLFPVISGRNMEIQIEFKKQLPTCEEAEALHVGEYVVCHKA